MNINIHLLLYFFVIVILVFFFSYFYNRWKNIQALSKKNRDIKNNLDTSISGKRNLLRTKIWTNTVNKYGLETACSIFPRTYILPADISAFLRDEKHNSGTGIGKNKKEYIAKTLNSGARKGVFLYEPEMRNNLSRYAVIQEYIPNPLLINGFKFDTRIFMVVDCDNGIFLFKPSYNVFTRFPFDYHSKDFGKKINQVYTDDIHYTAYNLPRKSSDLTAIGIPYDRIINQVADKLRLIVSATPLMCAADSDTGKKRVFGLDIEILDNYDILFIEINSLPDVIFADTKWKNKMTQPIMDSLVSSDFSDTSKWIQISSS